MAPPEDGNEYLPFAELMAIEKINSVTYRSIAKPFSPGGFGRAYGGHVYAQAVWAAAQTVPEGFVVHNATGWFILGGLLTVPFVYVVELIRDGGSYCTRTINVTQAEGKGICFTCTCSFKRAEQSPLDVQETIDIWDKYAVALEGKKEEDWPEAPAADMPLYWNRMKATGYNDPFPGVDTRKVDMHRYNDPLTPFARRQLHFYRVIGDLPETANPNLHACAHLYTSDRNSLFIVANHLEVGDMFHQVGSIAHTVVFHTPVEDLLMQRGDEKVWFCKEDWTTRAAGGRGMHHSRLIGRDGRHLGTTWQEGMVRIGRDIDDQAEGMSKLRYLVKGKL
ncbi:hypothetical protein ANO11243_086420 [Dothideomycetidae sp. 11243]|nr:hypothetical protein ANO11243_086420 [fungal sp. No.11243]